MKSVVQAGWLLTIGVSNIILTILNVAEVPTLQPQVIILYMEATGKNFLKCSTVV